MQNELFCWKEAVAVQVDNASTYQRRTDAAPSSSIRRITFHPGVESASQPRASPAFAEYYRHSLKEAINQASTIRRRGNNVSLEGAPCSAVLLDSSNPLFGPACRGLCVVRPSLCVCRASPTLAPASSFILAPYRRSSSCNRLAFAFFGSTAECDYANCKSRTKPQ